MRQPPVTAPVIGISGVDTDYGSLRAAVTMVHEAGGTPLFLGNHIKRDAAADIGKIDGLVVMGNNADIDPRRYGQQAGKHTKPESATPEGKARAEYEYAIMAMALEKKIPLMGICAGHQRLNVLLGGTLHQHVPDLVGNDDHNQFDHNIAPFVPVQPVLIDQHSTLASVAGDVQAVYAPAPGVKMGVVMENSMHHQAVDKVGRGLRVAAYAADAYQENGGKKLLVEAVEADPDGPFGNQMVLGVQWHPEFGASPLGAKLSETLVASAREYARERGRAHPSEEAVRETAFSSLAKVTLADAGAPPRAGGMTEMILRQRAQAAQLSR